MFYLKPIRGLGSFFFSSILAESSPIAMYRLLGNVDGTAVDTFLAQDHLEQRGLAATVTAYEPYALMVAHEQACAIEQNLHAE